jgi:hypothetical protein
VKNKLPSNVESFGTQWMMIRAVTGTELKVQAPWCWDKDPCGTGTELKVQAPRCWDKDPCGNRYRAEGAGT